MANYTPYIGLEKPLSDEIYDVDIFNVNADRIDTAVKQAGKELPPSVTMEYYGSSPPEGFLFCEGQAVSRIVYAALFSVIGVQHGAGDGSTTFNLPDHRGRIGVGKSTETEFNTSGKKGGTKTHVLTVAEIASHGHVQNAHNHSQSSHNHSQNAHNHTQNPHYHIYSPGGLLTNYLPQSGSGIGGTANNFETQNTTASNNATTASNNATTATNIAATAVNQNSGGGAAHNNLQPYIVCNQIIKY